METLLAKINIWDICKLKSTTAWCIKNCTGWKSLILSKFRKSKFSYLYFSLIFSLFLAPSETKIQNTLVSFNRHPERKILLWHKNKKRGIPNINRKNKTSLCATKILMTPYWDNLITEKDSRQILKPKDEQEVLERKPLKDKVLLLWIHS